MEKKDLSKTSCTACLVTWKERIMKEVVKEVIEIMKEGLASTHRYPECGGDPDPAAGCLDGTGTCVYVYQCTHSYQLEKKLNELLEKLGAEK
jgi:hypothetical protein